MRFLFTIGLAACLQVGAQPDQSASLESLLAEARQAQARNDFPAAADAYRKAAAIRPDLPELWSNLGLMQYESGEYSQAEQALRRAVGLKQALFVPNLFLGLDLLKLNRPREAVTYLLAAEKLNSQDGQVALALGRAFHILWEPDRSREWYQRATVLAPRNGEGWYGLGLAYFGLAESAGAKLNSEFAHSPYVPELTADTLAEQGRLADAIRVYRGFVNSADIPRCARTSFGFALLRHGDRAEAEQQFQRDLIACPAAKVGQVRLLFASGDRGKALAILAEMEHSDPEAFRASLPRFWEGLDVQQVEAWLGQLRQSRDEIARVLANALERGAVPALAPERAAPGIAKLSEHELLQFAGDAFFSGDFRDAAVAGDRLRQQYPNHAAGWYWAVRAYQKLGVAALVSAADVEPDSPRIHALLGDVYQKRKMFREAEEEYSRMLALSPDNIAALAGLAAAYLSEGQLEKAQANAQKALARNPGDSEINLLMGEILVAQHEYASAEPYLEHSLQARPDLRPRAHALLGRVFARTGRSQEAIKELRQGLASDEDGSVYYQLARLYQEAGDTKAAAQAMEKSREIRKKHDAVAPSEPSH